MTLLTKLGLVLVALLAIGGWFAWHDSSERKQGAQACIQSTTETKTEVKADNAADAQAQTLQLALVVKTYDDKVNDLARSNADLARRLHDNSVRQIPAAHPGPVAGGTLCTVDVPDGQASARAAAIDAATKKVFDDCDADYAGRVAVIQAYNDNRNRMIAAQK
jgi:hypothetical protein